ncbi:tellurite resistance TerB family protein [Azospirillum sp. RWY-5-1]|uniref:Tellurite resistance TerB family protein n=1 Tax=Azospirillum oleiclasticum TaxID=2735135 RepID=A0ABX2T7I6_9PROT|nr:DUF533 domain-containing protein [Azospirillum oleiclasticum]NYZ11728.1 tellurite resistance TerB family protein [Azospirillum oleiclasticum]NYZ18889.1 tellurite resistance TerB family protein [Azospirillum oleiclasticum]
MSNLTKLLGTLLASGMAGHSRRGPHFAASPFGMGAGLGGLGGAAAMAAGGRKGGFKNAAGLAALGYLAYKAYQDHQDHQGRQPAAGTAPAQSSATGGPSLGERLAGLLQPEQRAAPEAAVGDQKALLLIRAMVAAAAADGTVDATERRRILDRMSAAGADEEDRRLIERELDTPAPLDSIVNQVHDAETAEQVYLASLLAIEADSPAERSYLHYLAARLNIGEERARELSAAA